MSYPRKLHVLIVEDDQDPIDSYLSLLKAFAAEYPSVAPTVVRSYADARAELESDRFYHVVILDLNLPLANGELAPDGLAPGEQLLDMIARRDAYPVPVCLVISGKLGVASLSDLQTRLGRDFWYGQLVNKGRPEMPDEVKTAFRKAHEYSDVGVHIRDGGRALFPTLSPRENDLLRRCVLTQSNCLGVDAEWWAADTGPSLSRPSADAGPTKVLMGRFCLDDGLGVSRPTFFKFEPTGNAPFSCRDVGILDQKLSHVKLKHSGVSRERCLLVTQSVSNRRPLRLGQFLGSDPKGAAPFVRAVVGDITDQLEALGPASPDHVSVNQTLWPHHSRTSLQAAWDASIRDALKQAAPGPLDVYDRVRANTGRVWVKRRNCTHGDLNATNVAIDDSDPARPKAFIFDAAGVHADMACRDLAVLEVTALLFMDDPLVHQHFHRLKGLYADMAVPAAPADVPPVVANMVSFVGAIRDAVQAVGEPETYPLLVFDAALVQLGGLAGEHTRNKIFNPSNARHLAAWTAEWVARCPVYGPQPSAVEPSRTAGRPTIPD
jgi:CheY-like chemotaxis protein